MATSIDASKTTERMKSIKEKSFELFPEMHIDSDDWDVIEEQCDRDNQRKAFTKGANYVLEQIEKLTNNQNWCAFPKQSHKELKELIEQLKQ